MENLRRRVGEFALDKNWKKPPKEKEEERERLDENDEDKPLLKVAENFMQLEVIHLLAHLAEQ